MSDITATPSEPPTKEDIESKRQKAICKRMTCEGVYKFVMLSEITKGIY
jgi:hypothetical protein